MTMRALACVALFAAATPAFAQSAAPSVTRAEFIPICVETMRGTGTPAQYEMACLCIWE